VKPFFKAVIPPEEMAANIESFVRDWTANKGDVRKLCPEVTTAEEARARITATMEDMNRNERVWLNDKYQVTIRDVGRPDENWPEMWHLSIKRLDRQPLHDWRELQQIKNELVGPENEGCEVYPAESRLVDTSNQYHQWVFKDPAAKWPFGFRERCVTANPGGKAVQRAFEKEEQHA